VERRELLWKGLAGISLAWLPQPLISGGQVAAADDDDTATFYDLWEEARLCQHWLEDKRALDLYRQLLECAAPKLTTEGHADILEAMRILREALEETERYLPAQQAAVQANPEDPEKHFYLGFTLIRLGRYEEALVEFQAALRNPEALCRHCYHNCWINIGWYYYRRERYGEALQWFERAYQLEDSDNPLLHYDHALALENKLLANVALGRRQEAEANAREYISRFGRLPWPERRALGKLGIDADAIYLDRYGHLG